MSISQLKAEIVDKVTRLESETALLEVKKLLLHFESIKNDKVSEIEKADQIFSKAAGNYDNLLKKLAQ